MNLIPVFAMYALFASVFTVGKVTLAYGAPFFLTGIRMLLAGAMIMGYQFVKEGSKKITFPKELWKLVVAVSFFNVFLTNGLEFWGLQYMRTAKTSLIYSFSPFAAILLSYMLLSETMSPKKWVGLAIGITGFIPIFMTGGESEYDLFTFFSGAEIAVFIASISAVLGWVFMKRLTIHEGYSFFLANGWSFLIGGAMSLVVSMAIEDWYPVPVIDGAPFLAGALYIAIVHNLVGYNIYAWCLRNFSVTFMTFAGMSNPLFTALFGYMLLGETVGLPFFISIAMVFSGLYVFYKGEGKHLARG